MQPIAVRVLASLLSLVMIDEISDCVCRRSNAPFGYNSRTASYTTLARFA